MLIPCFSLNQEVNNTKFQITAIDSKTHKRLVIPVRKNTSKTITSAVAQASKHIEKGTRRTQQSR